MNALIDIFKEVILTKQYLKKEIFHTPTRRSIFIYIVLEYMLCHLLHKYFLFSLTPCEPCERSHIIFSSLFIYTSRS